MDLLYMTIVYSSRGFLDFPSILAMEPFSKVHTYAQCGPLPCHGAPVCQPQSSRIAYFPCLLWVEVQLYIIQEECLINHLSYIRFPSQVAPETDKLHFFLVFITTVLKSVGVSPLRTESRSQWPDCQGVFAKESVFQDSRYMGSLVLSQWFVPLILQGNQGQVGESTSIPQLQISSTHCPASCQGRLLLSLLPSATSRPSQSLGVGPT